MKTRILLLLALLAGAAGLRAEERFVSYDTTTKVVALPVAFWRSNLVDTAELSFSISGGRVTPVLASSITRDTELTAAISGLSLSINSGVPNGTGAKVHWSELLGVPAGFADGTDDGAGGGSGDVVGPASATDSVVALYNGTTGKLLKAGTLTEALIATDAELAAAISALSSTYQPLDADLTAWAGLSSAGMVARTGAGAIAARTLTGDTEIVIVNGDGVSGSPTFSIGSAIARVAAMAATYQPIHAVLSRLSGIGLGTSGDILIRDGNGWTNLVKSSDGKVLTLSGGLPSWQTPSGGGGDAFLGNSQTFSGATNQFTGQMIVSNLLATVLRAATLVLDAPIGLTAVGTNLADAQDELQLTPGTYTLPWDLQVWQLASMTWASGTMAWFDGSNVTNIQSTATGRLLIAAADAAAGRAAIAAPTWPSDAGYDESAWNGDTNAPTKNAVRDAIVAVVGSSNSVITSVDTNTFSTPGGKLTLNVNSGIPRWIDAVGIGTLTNINTATNGLGSWLISSNDVPGADGRYLDGTLSFAITNAAGGTVNFNFYVKLNGTVILNAQRSVSSSANLDLHEGRFRLIRQGTGLANFAFFGERHGASVPTTGLGSFGGSGGDSLLWATNAVCDWTTNVNLVIELVQSNLSGTNNAAAGSQRFGASLYRP